MRDYLQVRAGAAATGNPTETVDIDYGDGGNGKSKFYGAIQHVLGPYAVVPHKSLLVAERHEQHPTVVADLFRKRLAVASETKRGRRLDDESVKNLTGGDRLTGRRMREDPWEFWPTHTLVMFSNHRPAVHGRDEGIWRRLRLVPWEVTIPEDERDEHLADKLQAEAPGILRVDRRRRGALPHATASTRPPRCAPPPTSTAEKRTSSAGSSPTCWKSHPHLVLLMRHQGRARGLVRRARHHDAIPRMNEVAATLRERGCKTAAAKRSSENGPLSGTASVSPNSGPKRRDLHLCHPCHLPSIRSRRNRSREGNSR